MKIGALIVTTGLYDISGITALTANVGTVTAGQRMIAAFKRIGASRIGLVVGPEDKKTERLFAQTDVVFLRCHQNASFVEGVREGLRFMHNKYDRVFLVPGDMPLFLPKTLESMLRVKAPIVVPVHKRIYGAPVLLNEEAMKYLLSCTDSAKLEMLLEQCLLEKAYVPVNDAGIVVRGKDMSHRTDMMTHQERQLTHPELEISLNNGTVLYDSKLSMLLHLVEETNSVRLACSLMQLSYSAAWNILNHAEDAIGYPLVVRVRGGTEGSGSALTSKGRMMMRAYDNFQNALNDAADELYHTYFEEQLELN